MHKNTKKFLTRVHSWIKDLPRIKEMELGENVF